MSDLPPGLEIRKLRPDDSVEALTGLIHAAYAPLAAQGLRYWATHQSVADTARRFASGQGLIATVHNQYAGTITVRPPQPESRVAFYRDPTVWTIGQFAVLPALKGRGLGRLLHQAALEHALSRGGQTMALDTAEPATGLIELYRSWGYRVVGPCDWRPGTNYPSVVMARPLVLSINEPHPLPPKQTADR